MSRFIKIGLLASTMLAIAAPAVAQRGQDRDGGARGEWSRADGRSDQSRGGGDRQRAWSAPTPQGAPPREPAPAVRTTPVAPSDASGGAWRRLGNPARPDRDNGNGQGGREWNRDRTPPVVAAPAQPQPQPQQRNWSRNDGTPGQREWNRDNRNDRNDRGTWRGNDRNGRDNGSWNRGNNEWRGNDNNWQRDRQRDETRNRDWQRQQQQGYNYQRRLHERERWADTRRWDNGWRYNNRYDWQRYRSLNRHVYHLPSYYAPYGWNRGYSRFSIGIYLSNVLFASDYWIDDPYNYRLPPAYGPLRWVRYYDDALLVDIRDGYVVDVIHDFFW